jgi:hypothetical protein
MAMTGLFARLAQRIIERLPSKRLPSAMIRAADTDGLHVTANNHEFVRPWGTVARVVACTREMFPGNGAVLLILFEDKEIFGLTEQDENWLPVIETMYRQLPDMMPYTQWSLRLMSAPGEDLQLYLKRSE